MRRGRNFPAAMIASTGFARGMHVSQMRKRWRDPQRTQFCRPSPSVSGPVVSVLILAASQRNRWMLRAHGGVRTRNLPTPRGLLKRSIAHFKSSRLTGCSALSYLRSQGWRLRRPAGIDVGVRRPYQRNRHPSKRPVSAGPPGRRSVTKCLRSFGLGRFGLIVDRVIRVYGFAPITSVASRALHATLSVPSKPGQARSGGPGGNRTRVRNVSFALQHANQVAPTTVTP